MSEKTETALQILSRQMNQPLSAALEVCARCGICAEACHYYAAEPKFEHTPAARAEALRKVYRSEYDFLSRLFPNWMGAEKLTEEKLTRLAEIAFNTCTLCYRCTTNCPMGVDTPLLMTTLRAMATATGNAPEILEMLADAAIEKGRDPSMYLDFFLDSIKDMEIELQALTGNPEARIPVQKMGARILYVALAGAHTILPAAAIFDAAQADWCLSIFEAANYGIFLGDAARAKEIARRIVNEANELGVEEIVISECGHAYFVMRWSAPNWFGDEFKFRVRSIVEVLAEYIQEGRLKLDRSANPEAITYHDSCNLGRKGGVLEEARTVLHAVTTNFRELTPNREEAYCCGGGAGLVALPEAAEIRMLAGKPKAEQVRRSGAQVVVAACENCRLQLGDLSGHYGLGVGVIALADLVVKAMRLPGAKDSVEEKMISESVAAQK
ncbi:MAG: (Fe-S)-binding protein [Chloroflexota bacterium]|nr:MAG: (Fe-S)-binding protein [Chloroflexota bacterium]